MDRLQAMRVIQQVIDSGSFSAAAVVLDVSPPMVTRLVADLEKSLGAGLLHRSTRRLTLTDAGEQYLSRVRNVLQEIDEIESAARSETKELSGTLHIGSSPVLAAIVIPTIFKGFQERYPAIDFDVQVEPESRLLVDANDVTLLGVKPDFDANIIARRLLEDDVVLYPSPTYIKQYGKPKTPQDLQEHKCLQYRRSRGVPFGWELTEFGKKGSAVHVDIKPVMSANYTDTLMNAARNGAGIGIATRGTITPYLRTGELVQVLPNWIAGQVMIYAALPTRKFMPERVKVFLDYLTERAIEYTEERSRMMSTPLSA
jgi:DNA-binding transcriptional LysR family regulator